MSNPEGAFCSTLPSLSYCVYLPILLLILIPILLKFAIREL
nr:MAG TPA: hypothetical protein [Caudoviricetes sp.]DAQ75768.1 MAG TPA: hypothetical protein [Caudoviricetes sp.]